MEHPNSQPSSTKNCTPKNSNKAANTTTNKSITDSQSIMVTNPDQSMQREAKRRFSNSVDIVNMLMTGELFSCILCPSPMDFYCNVCEKTFCRDCTKSWLNEKASCPHCRFKRPEMLDVLDIEVVLKLQKKINR